MSPEDRLVECAVKADLPQARALINADPSLPTRSFAAALVTGNAGYVRGCLAADPGVATRPMQPDNLPPLLLCTKTGFARPGEPKPGPGGGDFITCVRLLAEAGAEVNIRVPFDPPHQDAAGSPLYYAAGVHGNVELARALLDCGASVHDGETLYHSVEQRNPDLLRLLHPYVTDLGDWSYAFIHLLDYDAPETVACMLGLGVDLTFRHHSTGDTALHWAVRRNRGPALIRQLIAAGADSSATDRGGLTPYQRAARCGDFAAAAAMERPGHQPQLDPLSRLLLAAALHDTDAVAQIRQDHPDLAPGPRDHLHLHAAAEAGRARAVSGLIRHAGLNPTVLDDFGVTALHQAAIGGHVETVQILIGAGADLHLKDTHHHSAPIGWACWGSLYRQGADPKAYAVVAEMLLAAGSPVPETAWGSPEVRDVLRRFGSATAAAG